MGPNDGWAAGAAQPTELPAFVRTLASDAPPMPRVGPNGPIVVFKSWQTVGSTAELVGAALALAAGTATATAAMTAVTTARGLRRDSISAALLHAGRQGRPTMRFGGMPSMMPPRMHAGCCPAGQLFPPKAQR
ncbi:hypothetical protein [Candidatus Solirubrobacter pratensis]|uniref:hypothetical protein n=1 Tax=Candidatus Solirubrobacter pratensis TaxID=1298857 RepID=UPI0012DD6092|nr:hypothetical protein [Candidatus Solirubrobacter pratensis]